MQVSGVYIVRHEPSGMAYLGSSRNVRLRWRGHQSYLARGQHYNAGMQQAWNADGKQAFSVALLEPVVPENTPLLEAEQRWWRWLLFAGVPLFPAMFPVRKQSPEIKLPGLRRTRLRAALSQRDLAKLAHVSPSTIARIESGEQAHPSTARRLAEALKCDPGDLMESPGSSR